MIGQALVAATVKVPVSPRQIVRSDGLVVIVGVDWSIWKVAVPLLVAPAAFLTLQRNIIPSTAGEVGDAGVVYDGLVAPGMASQEVVGAS
jgi:hypothetical protein